MSGDADRMLSVADGSSLVPPDCLALPDSSVLPAWLQPPDWWVSITVYNFPSYPGFFFRDMFLFGRGRWKKGGMP